MNLKYGIYNNKCKESLDKGLNVFIDDERAVPNNFHVLLKDYDTAKEFFKYAEDEGLVINIISFDHDLGESELKDSYELIKWLCGRQFKFKRASFHTENYTGYKNMMLYLKSWQKSDDLAPQVEVDEYKKTSKDYY